MDNIILDAKREGKGDIVPAEEGLPICGVLVQRRSKGGAVWVTGGGKSEQLPTSESERGYTLVSVEKHEKVSILKHPTYWYLLEK